MSISSVFLRNFKVDEVSIDEAEDDILFLLLKSCLKALRVLEDESTVGKRMYQFMNHHWKWVSSIK